MKQYIIYPQMLLLAAIILFTACEEDPEIPKVNYRYIQSPQTISDVPEAIFDYGFIEYLKFCIGNEIYISGRYEEYINEGEKPYNGRALYKWNPTDRQWKVAWYQLQSKLDELFNTDYEKADLLRNASDILIGNTKFSGCSYNGKGYVYDNNLMIEFNPTDARMEYYQNYENLQFSNGIFSTTEGVFGVRDNQELYQYSTIQHQWNRLGYFSNTQNGYSDGSVFRLFSQGSELYTWNTTSESQFSINTYTYPYTNYVEIFVERPHNYGQNNGYWDDMSNQYNAPFCINGKLYKPTSINGFYEYDLKTKNLTVAFYKQNEGYYDPQFIGIISNKLYFYDQSRRKIMEMTF